MDKQPQNIIKETFETPFEKRRFTGFVRNLLNHIEDAPFTYQGQYIPDAYKPSVSSLERIGKYSDGEHKIDILIVQLKKETSLERARTMQRNFIAWYLNGSRGGEMKDAALVAFVSPGEADWRFSLVKMDYRFEESKAGKIKVKEEFTPARRWSFLVGSNEASHTAQSRLVPILADDENNPTLQQLEDAFDIETVSKEFFLRYRDLFIRTKEALDEIVAQASSLRHEFETKGVDTVNFAKKLLGQIVFLYFLQKKGWFGVGRDAEWGTGSKHFLRQLFAAKHGEYKNFFNDILEPLFYQALRLDRRHDDDYYDRFNCKIPFLNGGLFDPIGNYDWVHTDILIPNELFSNSVKTKEGDTGTGILDVFDRYNFTVKEDEPLEKEVAIDPELLGKAYEKFNAIRPDNYAEYKAALKSGHKGAENKFNKTFGVYYTPREIVHYMCQQSLINYLYSVSQASSLSKSDRQDACDTQKASSLSKSDRQDACDTQNTLDTIMYFDPDAPISKKQRNLPHWQQKGTAYFVTFRLFDSIPKEVAESIKKEREQWLKSNNISDPSELKKLRRAQKIEYYRLFSKRYDDLLDNGYGCCVLAKPECKKIVEEALKHFDGDRYDLDKHVVMPNHVHTIVRPQKNWDLSQITHSWKSFTSNEINKILGRKGQLWMPESFDHIIRSPMQLEKIRHYIADNPKKSKVTQASQPEEPEYSQSQSEPLPTSHRQDACVTISKEDIETLIKSGEQVGEHEAAVRAKGRETKDYSHKLPESIRQNAARIDQALANITVCDPAIGSGAFPVGMMHEIVKTRNVLTNVIEASQPEKPHRQDACDPLDARATYQFKRQCIEKSLYGVDIDPGAVEIAKLRLWLSLVVDEEDIRRIKPLPNLDYKIVCGNSLLGVEKNLFNNQLFVELERLKPLYFDETNPTKKLEYKQQIDDLIGEIVTQPSRLKGRHRPHRQDACDAFDFEIYFSEVFHKNGGFDVVIGNPPYVRQEEIREYKSAFKSIYQCFTGMTDIYVYFYERGLNLLRENGVLTFITSNKYMRAGYGEKLRQFLTTRAAIRQLIDFGDAPVFEATAYPSIILLQKIKLNDNSIMALNWKRNTPVEEFEQEVHTGSFLIAQKELTADGWRIESPAVLRLLEKLRKAGQPLGEYVQERFYRGVLTGLNEAFVVDRGTRDRLIAEHPSSADVLKPFLRGRDVKRWRVDFSERYLIKIESSENETHPWSNREPKEAERIFAKTYQAIYSHLMQFRGKLIARDDQGKYFWELRSCKYWQEFEQPKIVIPAIDQNVNYAIDLLGFYSNDKTSICVGENVNYLAGLLNSRLLWWLIRMIAAVRQGGFYEFKPMYVSQIPIVAGIATNQIESIVDRVLTVKSDNPGADVTGLEREIDQLVYQLYGLTAEEIAIVEGQSNREA